MLVLEAEDSADEEDDSVDSDESDAELAIDEEDESVASDESEAELATDEEEVAVLVLAGLVSSPLHPISSRLMNRATSAPPEII